MCIYHVGVPDMSDSKVWLVFEQRNNTFLDKQQDKGKGLESV